MRTSSCPGWILGLALLFAWPAAAPAQSYTWLGGGGDNNWTTGPNWLGGTAPPTISTTTALQFTGTLNLTSNANQAFTINSLTFGPTAGAYAIGGPGPITFAGATPQLTNNSNTDGIVVNAPVVFANGGTIGGTGTGTFTVTDVHAADGTLTISRANTTIGTLRVGSNSGTVPGAAVNITAPGGITLTGDIRFEPTVVDPMSGSSNSPPVAITGGDIFLTPGNHTFFSQAYSTVSTDPLIDFTISARLTGPGGFVKRGSLTDPINWLLLSAQNTYAGPTILEAGSEVTLLGVNNTLPTTTALQVREFAELYLTGDYNGTTAVSQTVGSLSDGGGIGGIVHLGPDSVAVTTAVLTTGGDNTSTTFSGTILGGGSLVKVGTGTFTLTGNNAYRGGTTVNGGTLLANGQGGTNSGTGTGPVVVNTTGTLGGTGRVAGAVTVNTGGALAPGSGGIGTLTVGGNTLLNAGGRLQVEAAASGTSDRVTVQGATTTFDFRTGSILGLSLVTGFSNLTPATYTLVEMPTGGGVRVLLDGTATADGQVLGTYVQGTGPAGAVVINPSGFTLGVGDRFDLVRSGDAVQLVFTPVPEPATVLGLAAAGLGLGGLVRRARRQPTVTA
jgi:fibronectin-binding autotransporter adhesin